MSRSLRASALALASVAVLLVAGCASTPTDEGTDSPGSSGDAFPVTIEHALGTTVIPEQPERVVTWGWGSADAAIALGVVPVAIPFQSYGGDESGVLPWIRDALEAQGEEIPTVLPDSTEEPPYEDIIEADPDVIIAVYSGITAEEYELLSAIAPVVAYPEEAWSTPWKDVVTLTAEALGKNDEAEDVLAAIDESLAEQADAHPEWAGKTLAAVWDIAGTFYVYKEADPRVEFMLELGFENAPSVDELANGDETFYYTLSYEQLDALESDVVVSYSDTQAEADAFVASAHGSTIPAVAAGAVATVVGTEFIASVSPPTALSLTWGLDDLISALEKAVTK